MSGTSGIHQHAARTCRTRDVRERALAIDREEFDVAGKKMKTLVIDIGIIPADH
jgi:hypothetical protein